MRKMYTANIFLGEYFHVLMYLRLSSILNVKLFVFLSLPDVYTQFRKKVESHDRVRHIVPTPDKVKPLPPGIDPGNIPNMEDFNVSSQFSLLRSDK